MPRPGNVDGTVVIDMGTDNSFHSPEPTETPNQERFSKKDVGSIGSHLRNFRDGETGKRKQLSSAQKQGISLYIDSAKTADPNMDAIESSKQALKFANFDVEFNKNFKEDGQSTLKTKAGNVWSFVPQALQAASWGAGVGMAVKAADILVAMLNPTQNQMQTSNASLSAPGISDTGHVANYGFNLPDPRNISVPGFPSPNNTNNGNGPSDIPNGLMPDIKDMFNIAGTSTGTALAVLGGVAVAVVLMKTYADSFQKEHRKQAIEKADQFEQIAIYANSKQSRPESSLVVKNTAQSEPEGNVQRRGRKV